MHDWGRYVRVFAGTLAGGFALVLALIVLANPFGNLAFSPSREHVIMDTNQRFQYPAIARSGRYDSLVVGTSTSRLLRPADLERVLGGRFANLAMDSGTAWEQMRMAELFRRSVARPGTLLLGLDHVWCEAEADARRITNRGFPEWLHDDDPWNDLPNMLNPRTVEIAGRRVGHMLGLVPPRIPHDGYEVFLPPESAYDLARVRIKLYGRPDPPPPPLTTASLAQPAVPDDRRRGWTFPALAWLDQLMQERAKWRRIVALITPVHVSALPQPGSLAQAREAECKVRIGAIAERNGIAVVDFRIRSAITLQDENYWDPLHFRVPIADRIIAGLERAMATGADDPGGDWQLLGARAKAAAKP